MTTQILKNQVLPFIVQFMLVQILLKGGLLEKEHRLLEIVKTAIRRRLTGLLAKKMNSGNLILVENQNKQTGRATTYWNSVCKFEKE